MPLAIEVEADKYLSQRIELLHAEFQRVDRLAQTNELPEASVIKGVLKITPLDNHESEEAELLTRQALLGFRFAPRIRNLGAYRSPAPIQVGALFWGGKLGLAVYDKGRYHTLKQNCRGMFFMCHFQNYLA